MLGQVTHKFVRNAGYHSSIYNRQGNRHYPFENTLRILEDPKSQRQLYLIGTTHASTVLAYRTKALIEKVQPDSVYVQTNKQWYDTVSTLEDVKDQSQLTKYNSFLRKAYNIDNLIDNNPRGLFFKARLYAWLWAINWYKAFPTDFHPFTPGLEMKFALDEATKAKANIILGGLAIDEVTLQAFKTEPRFDVFQMFRRAYYTMEKSKFWFSEHLDHYAVLDTHGGQAFAESIDDYRLNWFIKYFEKISPHQKRILVDQKDLDIFYQLYRDTPGKKIVAVVNQWHLPGIEQHWRATTGTAVEQKPINPIGDFDIETYMETQLVNDTLRAFVSKLGNTEPATHKNYSTVYHKDNYEAERVRHVSFNSHDDPHMYHGLPQDYNDDMTPKQHH